MSAEGVVSAGYVIELGERPGELFLGSLVRYPYSGPTLTQIPDYSGTAAKRTKPHDSDPLVRQLTGFGPVVSFDHARIVHESSAA
jgi:hypothetical protein